jgi:hypothetical protein
VTKVDDHNLFDFKKSKDILEDVKKATKKRGMRTFSQTNFFKTQPKFFRRSSVRPEPFNFMKLTQYHKSKTREKIFMETISAAIKKGKED